MFVVTSDYLGNNNQTLGSLQKHLKDNVSSLRMSLIKQRNWLKKQPSLKMNV